MPGGMRNHQCPSCGAALGIPAEHDEYFSCKYCGTVIHDEASADRRAQGEAQLKVAPVDVASILGDLSTYSKAPRRIGLIGGIISLVITLAVVGGAIAGTGAIRDAVDGVDALDGIGSLGGADGAAGSAGIYSFQTAIDLPAEGEGGSDLLVAGPAESGTEMAYLDSDADDPLRWSVPLPGADSAASVSALADGEHVYVSAGDRLTALSRSDGSTVWSATLTDTVQQGVCVDCVRQFGDVIVTLAADGVLSAHAITDGAPRWSTTLGTTPRQIVSYGSRPAVLDEDDAGTVALHVFALDGSPAEVVPIGCPDTTFGGIDAPNPYASLVETGDGGVLYVSSWPTASCAQRWNPGQGGAAWTTGLALPTSLDAESLLLAGDLLLVAGGTSVDAITIADGRATHLADVADAVVVPLAAGEGTALIGVESTRGSGGWSLQGVDLAGAGILWQHPVDAGDPDDGTSLPIDTHGRWKARIASGRVDLVEFAGDPARARLSTIGLRDGVVAVPRSIDLPGDRTWLHVLDWRGEAIDVVFDDTWLRIGLADGAGLTTLA